MGNDKEIVALKKSSSSNITKEDKVLAQTRKCAKLDCVGKNDIEVY